VTQVLYDPAAVAGSAIGGPAPQKMLPRKVGADTQRVANRHDEWELILPALFRSRS
jgi:hypothetical protein